jgi:hypothetical protein
VKARISERLVAPARARRGWACTALVLACASGASVRVRAEAPAAASGEGYRIGAELTLSQRADINETLWVTSPRLTLDYAFHRELGVGVDWGFVLVNESPRHGRALWLLGSGDPLFRLWHTGTSRDGLDVWVLSLGVSAPLAWLSYDIEKRGLMRSAYAHAAGARGLWDVWLWGPEQAALVGSASWARTLSPALRVQLEGSLAGSLSLSQVTRDGADAYAQVAASLEGREGIVSAGLRLQQVLFTSSSDASQLSVVPYLVVGLGELRLALRAVINVDPPLGFFGGGGKQWGLLLSAQVSR